MDLTTVYDCMGSNLGSFSVPAGVVMAGYVTGLGGVPWTAAQLAQHAGVVRIDQSPENTPADETADVLDVENQAATIADIPGWVHAAWTSFRAGTRPGQRTPTIYCSRSVVTPVANALNAAGITMGVNLWIAESADSTEAAAEVQSAGGPFPVIGRQYAFLNDHDVSLFSTAWLNNVSGKAPVSPPKPGTQAGWRYCSKCTSLFYGPQQATSHCAAGGTHDGSHSHEYDLGYIQ